MWLQGEIIKSNNGSLTKSKLLFLRVNSEAPIPLDWFSELGFFESFHCEISDTNQFSMLVRPSD